MLNCMKLENFKAWREADLTFGKVTGFFRTNTAGKSSLFHSDFLGDFELEYENRMDSLYYLGPLREYPKREYHWAGSSP